MFEVQLPMVKKFQNVAGAAAGIGFILGTLIPAVAIFIFDWQCPFGDGILRIVGFFVIAGFGSAIIFGNIVALALVGFAKYRQTLSTPSRKRKSQETEKP